MVTLQISDFCSMIKKSIFLRNAVGYTHEMSLYSLDNDYKTSKSNGNS